MHKLSIGPFGETLRRPSAPLGAVPTKNMRWRPIHPASLSSIPSKPLPIPSDYREGFDRRRRLRQLTTCFVRDQVANPLGEPGGASPGRELVTETRLRLKAMEELGRGGRLRGD